MEYLNVMSLPFSFERKIGKFFVTSLSLSLSDVELNANKDLSSPSFFKVKISSTFEPKLALVNVALSVVPNFKVIVSSCS